MPKEKRIHKRVMRLVMLKSRTRNVLFDLLFKIYYFSSIFRYWFAQHHWIYLEFVEKKKYLKEV